MCIVLLSQRALTGEFQNPMVGFFPGITSLNVCTFFLGAFSDLSMDFSSLGIGVKPQTWSGFSSRYFRLRCSLPSYCCWRVAEMLPRRPARGSQAALTALKTRRGFQGREGRKTKSFLYSNPDPFLRSHR